MIIGLTGGIGSGKSTVASVLEVMGYSVYNSDKQAHLLCNTDKSLIAGIKQLFGDAIYEDGILNRKQLGEIVFKDKPKLNQLNAIIHPAVAQDFSIWQQKQNNKIVFKEAAILFESGAFKLVDEVVSVFAPRELRIERVIARDGLSKELVEARMANQWSDEQREKLTNHIIYADDKQLLIPQVLDLIKKINS